MKMRDIHHELRNRSPKNFPLRKQQKKSPICKISHAPSKKERTPRNKMSDKRETQDKPLVILAGAENYLRGKSYAMREFWQQGCDWKVMGREASTIESIRARLIERGFTNKQLKPKILINAHMDKEKKHLLAMSKARGLLFKLISDSLQPIIEGKMPQEGWDALQEKSQRIDGMSTSSIIYEATSRKLKDVEEYTSSYQAAFDKVASLLADTSPYTRSSTEAYFQATMVMNIGSEYFTLVSTIHKEGMENGGSHQPFRKHPPDHQTSRVQWK